MTDNFLIVASPRSGSNYLCGLLNQQADVKCYLEVFHPDIVPLQLNDWLSFGKRYTPQHRDRHPERFVRQLYSRNRFATRAKKIIGAKLLVHHHQVEYGLKPLFDKVSKIIFLERRNKLAWHASFRVALETGDWYNHPEKSQTHQIQFDEQTYFKDIEAEKLYFNKIISELSLARHKYIHFYYEEIKLPESMQKIATFLDLPSIIHPEGSAWSKQRNFLNSFTNASDAIAFAERNKLDSWVK